MVIHLILLCAGGQINDLFSTKMLLTLNTQHGLKGCEESWMESVCLFNDSLAATTLLLLFNLMESSGPNPNLKLSGPSVGN